MNHPISKPKLGNTPADLPEIQSLDNDALIERYAGGVHLIDARLLEATDEQLSTYFRPEAGLGRWSCRALIVHLADAESVMVHRMRKIACEDHPLLAIWDEDTFIDACVCDGSEGLPPPPIAGPIGLIHTTRLWTRDWLRSITPEHFDRQGLHPERGPISLRDILQYDTWHLEHHSTILSRKLDHMMGPKA